jgi:hypothetical protein
MTGHRRANRRMAARNAVSTGVKPAPRILSSASTLFAGRFNARQLYLHMINLQMQTLHLQNEWRTCNF